MCARVSTHHSVYVCVCCVRMCVHVSCVCLSVCAFVYCMCAHMCLCACETAGLRECVCVCEPLSKAPPPWGLRALLAPAPSGTRKACPTQSNRKPGDHKTVAGSSIKSVNQCSLSLLLGPSYHNSAPCGLDAPSGFCPRSSCSPLRSSQVGSPGPSPEGPPPAPPSPPP